MLLNKEYLCIYLCFFHNWSIFILCTVNWHWVGILDICSWGRYPGWPIQGGSLNPTYWSQCPWRTDRNKGSTYGGHISGSDCVDLSRGGRREPWPNFLGSLWAAGAPSCSLVCTEAQGTFIYMLFDFLHLCFNVLWIFLCILLDLYLRTLIFVCNFFFISHPNLSYTSLLITSVNLGCYQNITDQVAYKQ